MRRFTVESTNLLELIGNDLSVKRQAFEGDMVSESFELGDQASGSAFGVAAVEPDLSICRSTTGRGPLATLTMNEARAETRNHLIARKFRIASRPT